MKVSDVGSAKQKILKHLNGARMGDDDIVTTAELSETLGIPDSTIKDYVRSLPKHNYLVNRVRYWGNMRAIAALRRQQERTGEN
jgi:hypothetical protein